MSSAGPNNPTSGTNASGIAVAWSDPGNVLASDDSRATAALTGSGSTASTRGLECTGFGFSVPSGATIDGIVVEIERSVTSTSGSPRDDTISVMKAGSPVGSNKADATTWPTTDAYATYGNSTDLWGTTWTVTEINDSSFGAFASAIKTSGETSTTVRIDHIRITVYYTEAGGASALPPKPVIHNQAINRASRW